MRPDPPLIWITGSTGNKTDAISYPVYNVEHFEWWSREDFQGRFNMVLGADENMQPVADPAQLDIITVPDDCIICDYCNDDLAIFPVPILNGSALCPECFKRLVP